MKLGRAVRLALALALGLLLFAVPVAAAQAPSWLEATRIEPSQGVIYGLSCPSRVTCVAASLVPVIQNNDVSYEPATDPDPHGQLDAVSCAPGTRFCAFVDSTGGAFTFDGENF